MPLKSGLAAQVGYKKETTFNTYVAPDRFVDFVSEGITATHNRVESKAIRANQRFMRSDDWNHGNVKVEGDLEFELWNKSFGTLLEFMMGGSVTTTGAGPYTHEWTPGDLASYVFQVGRPDVGGTVRAFSYTGCVCSGWELSTSVGDPIKVAISLVGAGETTAQALATASYATGVELLTFVGASMLFGDTPAAVSIKGISIKGDNGLDSDRYFLGTNAMKQPLEAAHRSVDGEFTAEFEDLSIYTTRIVGGDEATLILTFAGQTNPTHKLVVTLNVRCDGDTPTVGGTDIVELPVKFKALATGADSTAVKFVYTTSDATP